MNNIEDKGTMISISMVKIGGNPKVAIAVSENIDEIMHGRKTGESIVDCAREVLSFVTENIEMLLTEE